jgi:phosphomevalonate kinase
MLLLQNGITDRDLLLELSLKSHRAFSGGIGSGADVAASVYGTTIQFALGQGLLHITPIMPNEFINRLIVVSTSSSQDTRDFVQRVIKLSAEKPDFINDFVTAAKMHCLGLIHACTEQDFINAIDQFAWWLLALGTHAEIALATEEHKAIVRLAKSLGGTAKPSGAGGGDISIAYVPSHHRDQFVADVGTISGCSILQ